MTLTALATAAGWILAGILAVIGVLDRATRQRRKEDDETASNLIQNLKTKTELQEKEIETLRNKEVSQGKEIAHLQGQLKMLSEIMQGRDPAMQSFLKDAPVLMTIARENNGLAKESSEAITRLADTMTDFIAAMHPIVMHIQEKKETV